MQGDHGVGERRQLAGDASLSAGCLGGGQDRPEHEGQRTVASRLHW